MRKKSYYRVAKNENSLETYKEDKTLKEYHADPQLGEKVYRQVRQKYRRYRTGMILCLIQLGSIAGIHTYASRSATTRQEMIQNNLNFVLLDIVLVVLAIFFRLASLSGGKEALMKTKDETISFGKDCFYLKFAPGPEEPLPCRSIQSTMYFKDVTSIEDDILNGRLIVKGKSTRTSYNVIKEIGQPPVKEVTVHVNDPIYIHKYYKDFEKIQNKLQEVCNK